MRTLFILSIASGYGGAERSIETLLQHLPSDVNVHIYAESQLHIERLSCEGALPKGARLVRTSTQHLWGRRLAAMAAKFIKDLGQRSTLYVRDFLWRDLDFIFDRLQGAHVITPSPVVTQRIGYLNPFYMTSPEDASFGVIPDMVRIPSGPVRHDGPLLHLATINPWKGHADLMLALHLLKRQGRRVPSVSHAGGPETFGRATIEAWAYRKPVVAYASGANVELIEDGVNGLLVPEGDTQALANAIGRLDEHPQWAQQLGETGHQKVLAQYEATSVTRRLIDQLLPRATCQS